jgi:hypothetical protein
MSIDSALQEVSEKLGIKKEDLTALINFESGFNPKAKNPYSSAQGLLQWIDSVSREMGYKDTSDLIANNPDAESQIRGPVYKYLKKYAPFDEPYPQSLYMSVFYPAYRNVDPDTTFSDTIRKANPGITKVSDYVAKVEKKKVV